jgi:hypothetical protein
MFILGGQEIGETPLQIGSRIGVAVGASNSPKSSSTRYTVPSRLAESGGVVIARNAHARLRAGAAGAPLGGAGGRFLSWAMLRRRASIRLITRRGTANVGFG